MARIKYMYIYVIYYTYIYITIFAYASNVDTVFIDSLI